LSHNSQKGKTFANVEENIPLGETVNNHK
jgi:hypothetical protein